MRNIFTRVLPAAATAMTRQVPGQQFGRLLKTGECDQRTNAAYRAEMALTKLSLCLRMQLLRRGSGSIRRFSLRNAELPGAARGKASGIERKPKFANSSSKHRWT